MVEWGILLAGIGVLLIGISAFVYVWHSDDEKGETE